MNAKVKWNGGLAFTASADTEIPVPLDAEEKAGGTNRGVRPMELIAMGLAGCTAMDVISILQKKQQKVTNFEVKVDAERASEHPRVFTRAAIVYLVTGIRIDESAVRRAVELSVTKYCPAYAMFSKVFPIQLRYEIYEEGGSRAPVKESVFEIQTA